MSRKRIERISGRWCVMIAVLGLGVVSVAGCAGDSPKPTSTMTQDQVKGNADKAFEKLKQEEKNRTSGSGAAAY